MKTRFAVYDGYDFFKDIAVGDLDLVGYGVNLDKSEFHAVLTVDRNVLCTIENVSCLMRDGWTNIIVHSQSGRLALMGSVLAGRASVVHGPVSPSVLLMEKKEVPRFSVLEKSLLHCLSYGFSTKELCLSLEKSERSIRRIKNKLLEKTGLFSSQQLAVYAILSLYQNSALFT